MKNSDVKSYCQQLRKEGNSYRKIGEIVGISLFSARNMCVYKSKLTSKKGPKPKINKMFNLRIKRAISSMKSAGEKVNSSKILNISNLPASTRTVQRFLKKNAYKYKKAHAKIILTKKHKDQRNALITKWISNQHPWEKTVFSDEKRFALDGPDDWRSYVLKSEEIYRNRRQCKGGSIMVWMMALPNGLLCHSIVEGILNSEKYIDLLKKIVVPIIKLNYGDDFVFQEDNAPIHKSHKVRDFMNSSKITVIEWPAKSPDLNIVENIWKIISDRVYDGPQFRNKVDLVKKIDETIRDINESKRSQIVNLYGTIRSRLCTVLCKGGDLIN